jgi:hypothetical protein
MEEWKSIEPGVWKPQKHGEQIMGVLVSKVPEDENTGFSARYYLDTPNGMFFLWSTAVLEDRMQYVKIGDKIRITFEGKTKNKRNQDVNLFKVEIARKPQAENLNDELESEKPAPVEQIDEIVQ